MKKQSSTKSSKQQAASGEPGHLLHSLCRLSYAVYRPLQRFWRKDWWHKVLIVVGLILALTVGSMYAIARWYMASQANKPLTLGASFIPDYARGLGVDPHDTLQAMINDLGVKNFRLVSYWEDIEQTPGHYNFAELDQEFQMIAAAHGTVSLSIGLRQPRWPECHAPSWVDPSQAESTWYPQLKQFMQTVINRYKRNPALGSYQLENEYFLKFFGKCTNFDRARLVDEYNFVKQLDPAHTVIVARSNNAIGLPLRAPTPDEFAVSVYKRVWVPLVGRYVEYPFPAWFYGFLAGAGKILTGKDMIIHELQAEPWPPHGQPLTHATLDEQNKSLNAERLKGRFNYGEATGIRTMYLWGTEYWYYRKVKLHDPSVWNTAKQEFIQANLKNSKLKT